MYFEYTSSFQIVSKKKIKSNLLRKLKHNNLENSFFVFSLE